MKFAIKTAGELSDVIQAAANIRKLTKSRCGFKKKLLERLEQKGGEYRLWFDLSRLAAFGLQLRSAPAEVTSE